MARTPRTRHSKVTKRPVTIDLEAERAAAQDETSEPGPAGNEDAAGAVSSAGDAGTAAGETTATPGPEASSQPAAGDDGVSPDGASGPRKRSFPSLLAAGVIGGLIAMGAMVGLNWSGLLPSGNGGGALQESVNDQVRGEIASLKAELDAGIAAADRSITGMAGRIEALEDGSGVLRSELEQVKTALADGAAGDGPALQVMQDRLDALEQRIAGLADAEPGGQEHASRMAALEGALGELRAAAETARVAAAENSSAIDAMRRQIDDLGARLDESASRPEVALAIAAAALKSAIDTGSPFVTELETFASILPDSSAIEPLRAMAETGVPPRARIAAEVQATANALLAAVHRAAPDAGFFERLSASLRSLVTVRPIGLVEGDTPAAIVARMEVAIAENDYARAIAEFENLPDHVRPAGEAFITKVRERLQADELIDQALASALRPSE